MVFVQVVSVGVRMVGCVIFRNCVGCYMVKYLGFIIKVQIYIYFLDNLDVSI